ncbi:MAG: hypothetical protein GX347_09120 [Epulopiscium sp.]|nr:hypothetical protein [Candidatus Epulonipiscium sp.]
MNQVLEHVKKYAPYIYFDEKEPFFPKMTGYTIFNETKKSSSFHRLIEVDKYNITQVIEYAIYWNYDITHLYDLEHYWVFIGKNGEIVDAQGSFHGKYITVLMKDKSNILNNTHVKIYAQPGKHAFAPSPMLFNYVPGIERCTYEDAGTDGLIVTEMIAKGRYHTTEKLNRSIQQYMKQYKFKPSYKYNLLYKISEHSLVKWEILNNKIPEFLQEEIKKINTYTQVI